VQIRNSTKLVGRVGVAAVLVTIVFLLVVFDVYVAAFIDALLVHLHVTGTHTFGDGSYTGEWCGGKRHGQGIMRALGVHLPDLAVCLAVAGLMIAFIYVVFFIVHLSVSVSACRHVACSTSRLLSAVLFRGASSVRA
jgi:hypothetical protein